jgi:hypothetical protein
MSTPIKPPESTPFSQPTGQVSDVNGTEKPSKTFQEVMDTSLPLDRVSGPIPTSLDQVQAIADQLKTGKIDTDTAITRLIENALSNASISNLSSVRKTELEKLLRVAVQSDPTLETLTRDLKRQGPIEK